MVSFVTKETELLLQNRDDFHLERQMSSESPNLNTGGGVMAADDTVNRKEKTARVCQICSSTPALVLPGMHGSPNASALPCSSFLSLSRRKWLSWAQF